MSKAAIVEAEILAYLEQVSGHLTHLTAEESDEILDSIRSHIDTALKERNHGEADLNTVRAVLAELDPPESYADSMPALAEDSVLKPELSKHGIIGAILLPFGVILAFTMMSISSSSSVTYVDGAAVIEESRSIWQWLASFILIPMGIISPFATTALGLMGLSKIRHSKGRITGLPLAFSVAIFYPIVILDATLFLITVSLFQATAYWNIAAVTALVLILAIDYFVIQKGWQTASAT